jgi:hypothetical protein
MFKLLAIGVLAALFFSSTFLLNRAMSLAGGHWVWSAGLRCSSPSSRASLRRAFSSVGYDRNED